MKLKEILTIARINKKNLIFAYLTFQISIILILLAGILLKEIFTCLQFQESKYLWLFIFLYLFVLILRILLVYIFAKLEEKTKFEIEQTIQRKVILDIYMKHSSEHLNKSVGSVINILKFDTYQIGLFFQSLFIDLPSLLIFGIMASVILININFTLFIVLLVTLIIIMISITFLSNKMALLRKNSRTSASEYSMLVSNSVSNYKIVKLHNSELSLIKELMKKDKIRIDNVIKENLLNILLSTINAHSTEICICTLLIAISVIRSANYTINIGDLTLFVSYISALATTLKGFGEIIFNYKRMRVSYLNIKNISNDISFLDYSIDIYEKKDSLYFDKLIINKMSFIDFQNNFEMKDISFQITKGEKIIITGPTKSGKSLLLKMLYGSVSLNDGTIDVEIDGKNTSISNLFFSNVSLCPQNPKFFNLSMVDNIVLDDNYNLSNLKKAASKAEFYDELILYNNKSIGVQASKISGGQKKDSL